MEIDNVVLEFTPEFLDSVVEKVYNTKRGARALRSEIEKEMRELTYELDDDSYGKTISL
jgi:ATP-dependent protease Clp ATPase subunit